MTNSQPYLALGIPTLLLLLNSGIMLFLFMRVESRLDRVESRLDRLNADLRQSYPILGAHGEPSTR